MRWVVYALAGLVALKIYMQDQMYRQATAKAIIAAYQERALAACRAVDTGQDRALAEHLWAKPGDISIEIGRNDLGVALWQLDHAQWPAAYEQAYLVLSPVHAHTGFTCTYDLAGDAATVTRSG